MQVFKSAIFVTVVLSGVAGCARGTVESARPETPSNRAERDADVISAAALADPGVSSGDVLEAVRRLRPQFLMSRGSVSILRRSAGVVHASIDFGPLMSVDNLKRMRVAEVTEIRYLNGRDAALRFGTSASSGGVIVVTSRR
jgi:hypothetical protein